MEITSMDLVPESLMTPEELNGSYMESLTEQAESMSDLLALAGYPPVG